MTTTKSSVTTKSLATPESLATAKSLASTKNSVTTKSLRRFADDCLAWALKQDDASQKQSVVTAGLSWKATADAIDSQVKAGRAEVLPDLKTKLN